MKAFQPAFVYHAQCSMCNWNYVYSELSALPDCCPMCQAIALHIDMIDPSTQPPVTEPEEVDLHDTFGASNDPVFFAQWAAPASMLINTQARLPGL